MKKVPKWQKSLSAKERKHLVEDACVTTLARLNRNMEEHARMRRENPDGIEPCFVCKGIARKLGIGI